MLHYYRVFLGAELWGAVIGLVLWLALAPLLGPWAPSCFMTGGFLCVPYVTPWTRGFVMGMATWALAATPVLRLWRRARVLYATI